MQIIWVGKGSELQTQHVTKYLMIFLGLSESSTKGLQIHTDTQQTFRGVQNMEYIKMKLDNDDQIVSSKVVVTVVRLKSYIYAYYYKIFMIMKN